jgi:hypothetical protein
MPDDSMYPDDAPPTASADSVPDKPEEKDNEKGYEGHTELVSKKLLDVDEDSTVKPGDEFVLQVVKDWGNEVELKYAPKKESKTPDDKMSADEELDSMESSSMKGKS